MSDCSDDRSGSRQLDVIIYPGNMAESALTGLLISIFDTVNPSRIEAKGKEVNVARTGWQAQIIILAQHLQGVL